MPCDFERNLAAADAVWDFLRCTCVNCHELDMHGCAVMENIGGEEVMVGVICRNCQSKHIKIKSLL